MDIEYENIEIISKRLDFNLCQFDTYFNPRTTYIPYIKAKPRVIKVVISKLDSILMQMKTFGFQSPEAIFCFGSALETVCSKRLMTVQDIIKVFESEIENLRKLDRGNTDGDLVRARKFAIKMSIVCKRLNVDAQARLRVVVNN